MVAALEEFFAGEARAPFGKCHGIGQNVPGFQLPGDFKISVGSLGPRADDGSFQGADRFRVLPQPRVQLGDFDEPPRIAIGQLIEPCITLHRVVEAHQALFQTGLGFQHVRTVRPRLDAAFVIGDGRRKVFGHGFDSAQHDWPAIIERRLADGLAVEGHQRPGLGMRHGVGRRLFGEPFVFGVPVDYFDVLRHRAGIVFQTVQCRNQTAPDDGDPFDALRGRQRGLFQSLDGGQLVIAEPAVVLGPKIRVRHRGEVFGAQRIAREQPGEQRAGAVELARGGGNARRFQRELCRQIGSGVRCGFQQQSGRLRVLAVPHMKIDSTAHDSQNQRMVTVQGIHHASRLIDLLLRFEQPHVGQDEPHLVHRIAG